MTFSSCWGSIWTFLGIFTLSYFLETITFTYLVSTIQSVERQFQIPSRLSGTLVSASDVGYVGFIVFLSYFGSKGNRARWIGSGFILISLACLLISLPHFIFPHNDDESGMNYPAEMRKLIRARPELLKTMPKGPPMKIPSFGKGKGRGKRDTNPADIEDEADFVAAVFERVGDRSALFLFNTDYGMGDEPTPAEINALQFHPKPLMGGTRTKDQVDPNDLDTEIGQGSGLYISGPDSPPPDLEIEGPEEIYEAADNEETGAADPAAVGNEKKFGKPKTKNREDSSRPDFKEEMAGMISMYAEGRLGFCMPLGNLLKTRVAETKCETSKDSFNVGALAIVYIGIMMIGIGHSMPWSLGVPLIDDSVKKQNTPLYFGAIFFIRIAGPVVGFILGGSLNLVYVTLKAPKNLSPMSSQWIGAWWLGYLVVAAALFIPASVLFFLPRREIHKDHAVKKVDPPTVNHENRATNKVFKNGEYYSHDELEKKPLKFQTRPLSITDVPQKNALIREGKGFLIALKKVLGSPVYVACLVGRLFDAFAFKGFFVFLPKYLESHYNLPQFKANMLLGIFGIVGFAAGILIGSIMMKKLKYTGRKAAAYIGLCSLLSFVISLSEISLGCFSPINQIGEIGKQTNFNYSQTCNSECECDPVKLLPVCDAEGNPFFSPCAAGCTSFKMIDMKDYNLEFHNCSCVGDGQGYVSTKTCKDSCHQPMVIYFALMVISGLIGGTSVIPGVLIVLRSVPHEVRSVALGFSGFVVSLISTFPSPIVYGFIVDSACLLWSKTCTGSGACDIYDPDLLRWRVHLFHGLLRGTALIFDVVVWYFAKNLVLMDDPAEEPIKEVEKEFEEGNELKLRYENA